MERKQGQETETWRETRTGTVLPVELGKDEVQPGVGNGG